MNFYADNPDLQHHFGRGIAWESFVPLWERGFGQPDGPASLEEARELYAESLSAVGEFAAEEAAPRAEAIDAEGVRFEGGRIVQPRPLLQSIEGLRKLGAMAPSLGREQGGLNYPFCVSSGVLELLARACTSTMILYAFHQSPALMVRRFGSREQVARWVPPLAAGEISGSIAITEPEVGSDIPALATRAERDGAAWRLHGRKQFITNGCGELCLVLARSAPGPTGLAGLSLFAVPRELEGRENYQVARPEKKSVIRGSATCELHFDGSRAELLGGEGQGFRHMLTFMNEARVAVGMQGLGLMQAALAAAERYAAGRVQGGRPIARHPMIADLLLDLRAETAALRALIYRTVALQDRLAGAELAGKALPAREQAALKRAVRERTPLVKWLGSERALWAGRAAVQVHGGYGVVQEYGVERLHRDALILPIYEGTSQIQALMSLRDQAGWTMARPWRLLGGGLPVEAAADSLGDALREMGDEYARSLRGVLRASTRLGDLVGRRGSRAVPGDSPALLHAERLVEMLALARAAEALAATAADDAGRRRLAERYAHRALLRARLLAELIRSDDGWALEVARGT